MSLFIFLINCLKIIHFVRHGEGFHNALARKIGRKAYLDPAVFDPELTDVGIQQAKDLQDEVLNLYLNDPNSIDCIVFSNDIFTFCNNIIL